MRKRVISGVLLILGLLGAAVLDSVLDGVASPGWLRPIGAGETLPPGLLVLPIVLTLAALMGSEIAEILRRTDVPAHKPITSAIAVAGVVIVAFVPLGADGLTGAAIMSTAVAVVAVGSLAYYARHRQVQGVIASACGALLAFSVVGVTLGFMVSIRREHAVWVLVWLIITTKCSDIGALLVGLRLGKTKLIPWLSPGKTWEGFAGGVAASGLVGAGGAWWLAAAQLWPGIAPGSGQPVWTAALLGGLLGMVFGIVGQAGDLVASLLKRDAGVKDSGSGVPGMGGVLDVIDSLLLVTPLGFWMLRVMAEAALNGG